MCVLCCIEDMKLFKDGYMCFVLHGRFKLFKDGYVCFVLHGRYEIVCIKFWEICRKYFNNCNWGRSMGTISKLKPLISSHICMHICNSLKTFQTKHFQIAATHIISYAICWKHAMHRFRINFMGFRICGIFYWFFDGILRRSFPAVFFILKLFLS